MWHRSKAWYYRYTGSFGITTMSSISCNSIENNTASGILHSWTSKLPSESNMMIVRGRLCVGRTSNYSVRVICEWKCQKVGTRATFKKPNHFSDHLDSKRTVLLVSSLPWVWGICFFGTIPGGAVGSSDLTKFGLGVHSCCCSYFWFFMIIPMNAPIEGVALLRRPCYLCGRKRNSFRNITKRQKKAHTVMWAKTVSCRMHVELCRNCTRNRLYSQFMIESSPGLNRSNKPVYWKYIKSTI